MNFCSITCYNVIWTISVTEKNMSWCGIPQYYNSKSVTSRVVERVIRNALHHAANQIVAFCLVYGITIFYAGDLGTLNYKKRHRRSRRTNQDVGALEFGCFEQYLEYKLRRHGIQLIKISEALADTSQTCPHCGHLNKVAGRTYHCRACDYRAHRDGVGAVTILNQGMHSRENRPRGAVSTPTDHVSPSRSPPGNVKA